jgi:hypothetical protein
MIGGSSGIRDRCFYSSRLDDAVPADRGCDVAAMLACPVFGAELGAVYSILVASSFNLAAIAQNLRRLGKPVALPPPRTRRAYCVSERCVEIAPRRPRC